jgi:hypothetical protein
MKQLVRLAAVATVIGGIASLGLTSVAAAGTQHYEYVFPDGGMSVYDMDNGHALVKQLSLPTTAGVRGVAVDPRSHALYVSFGGDGGSNGNGSLLKFDLLSNSLVWTKGYSHGIDSFAINPAGTRIYMPDGELSPNGLWYVVNTATGNELGSINGGLGPHNTIVSLSGAHVYLGGRNYNYLEVADPLSNLVIRKIGPLRNGVRPFTINGTETLALTTATGFLGFQVSSIPTGQVLYTVPVAGFPCCGAASAPSHGISLSPDEKEIYLVDSVSSYVHVFDVSGLPSSAPRQVADIKLAHSMSGNESGCAYDCLKDGWVQHSRDGRFVYVGDSGDVISTSSRSVVAYLPALANTRKMLEVDWSNGGPVFTTTRSGLGYVLAAPTPTPTPTPTATPTPTPYPTATPSSHPSSSPTPNGTPRSSASPSANATNGGTSSGSHAGGAKPGANAAGHSGSAGATVQSGGAPPLLNAAADPGTGTTNGRELIALVAGLAGAAILLFGLRRTVLRRLRR